MTIDECLKKAEVVLRAGENKSSAGDATRLSRAGLMKTIMINEKGYNNNRPIIPEGLTIRLTKAAMEECKPLTAEELEEEICKNTFKKYDTEVKKCCRTCARLRGMTLAECMQYGTVAIPGCEIRERIIRSEVNHEFSGRVTHYELDTIYGGRCHAEIDNFSKQCCDLYKPITNRIYLYHCRQYAINWILKHRNEITDEWIDEVYDFSDFVSKELKEE